MKAGIDIVVPLAAAGLIPTGTKKAAVLDIVVGLIEDVAARIYVDVMEGGPFTPDEEEDPSAPPSSDFKPTEA
jgi:hypothetical protein